MARAIQPSLNGGEISDHLQARVDVALYQKAVKRLRNFFARRTGGASTRPGTALCGRAYQQGDACRLARFIYSRDEAYLVEFTAGKAVVWYQGERELTGIIIAVSAITESGGFYITTSAPHGLSTGRLVVISGATGTGTIDAINGEHVITVNDATHITVPKWVAGAFTYSSGASIRPAAYVNTPYAQDDLVGLRFAQSADVMTVTHNGHMPYELRRNSGGSWTFSEVANDDGPFTDMNQDDAIRVWSSAATGSVTITSTSAIFTDAHVGALFYIEERNGTQVKPWEAGKLIAWNYCNGYRCRSDGKVYVCTTTSYSQMWHCGTIPPTHEAGRERCGNGSYLSGSETYRSYGVEWEYEHSGYGIARITAVAVDGLSCTATVLRTIPSSVVGGSTTSAGPWSMTGDGVDTTLTVTGATSTVEEQFLVTLDNVPLSPSQYTVSGSTLTFVTAPGAGVAVVAYQFSVDNRTDFWAFGAWSDEQGYPGCVSYYGDRLMYGGTSGTPQRIDGSRVGDYENFLESTPLRDDDPIKVKVGGREMAVVLDLLPMDRLIAMTSSGVYRVGSIDNDILTPGTAQPKLLDSVPAADIPAVLVRRAALFVERGETRISELQFADASVAETSELTLVADHLWRGGKSVIGMDFAAIPYGLLYAVRSDGSMPVLAYLKEQEVLAWSVYETDGVIEQVCVIPEGDQDVVYISVARTINGTTRRFIEKFTDREPADHDDLVCSDCSLSYDGRNILATTVDLGGTSWAAGQEISASFSVSQGFDSSYLGDEVWVEYTADDGDTEILRMTIASVVSGSIVLGHCHIDVPVSLRTGTTTAWSIARATFGGLSHLAGETVAIQADSTVQESQTVASDGTVTLTEPGAVVHIGLPFTAYIETLELNVVGRETIRTRGKTVPRVAVMVSESRGLWAGPDENHLEEWQGRDVTDEYSVPEPYTGMAEVELNSTWDDRGSVQLWQRAAAPLTILAVLPRVEVGEDS